MILPPEALAFAMEAHGTQVRKYTFEPYITHPISVACILQQHHPAASHTMITAAILHDVVEDTEFTIVDIDYAFGSKVSALVHGLTDISKPADGNRAVRKAIDCAHIAKQSTAVQIIKCADLIHNTTSIVAHSPVFARIYLPEAKLILEGMNNMTKASAIYKFAWGMLVTGMVELGIDYE